MVTLFLTFWRASRLFSKMLQRFTFLSAEYKCSYLSTFSVAISIFHFLDYYYPSRYKVVSYWNLDFHFPYGQWCPASFHLFVYWLVLYLFFWEMSSHILCLFLNCVVFILLNTLYILDPMPYEIYDLQSFSLIYPQMKCKFHPWMH